MEIRHLLIVLCLKSPISRCIKILLDNRADPNQPNDKGETPLEIAITHHSLDVVNCLLSHKDIDINKANTNNGVTPLIIAAAFQKTNLVNLLLEKGADINHSAKEGLSAIAAAIHNKNIDIVKILLAQKGINLDLMPGATDTPLGLAKQMKLQEITDILNDHLELFKAVAKNSLGRIQQLLEKG
ncbi:MAG UNVERIFIED_CONTAM: ankyrin repeat domain-containing protein [Rickettsiaceae bacterium]|jgi:ankyrin